jgi:hypothetical protein
VEAPARIKAISSGSRKGDALRVGTFDHRARVVGLQQEELNDHGASVDTDGIFGDKTAATASS